MKTKTILATITVIIIGGILIYSFKLNIETKPLIVANFEECIAAGNPAMESHPKQCNDGENNFIEDISIRCTQEQRGVEVCASTRFPQPVCATMQNTQCTTEPCDPVKETFENSCFACLDPLVESYIPGTCF